MSIEIALGNGDVFIGGIKREDNKFGIVITSRLPRAEIGTKGPWKDGEDADIQENDIIIWLEGNYKDGVEVLIRRLCITVEKAEEEKESKEATKDDG